ncbi:autotransporter-associated beta strand repeat-containing protein, partial [Mycoplana ramosa]
AGGGFGGGGGGGGDGLLVLGGNSVITNIGTITGGVGGAGGTGSSSGQVGSGQSGAGVNLVGSGSTLVNSSSITGGAGNNAAAGAGVITSGNATITNGGTISGGLSSDGITRAAAVHFQGAGNTLNLLTGSNLVGSLDLAPDASATIAPKNAGLTLGNGISLGGTSSAVTFDTGTADLRATGVITGSGTVTKAGSNTLTLTGTNTYSGGTTISGGTLRVGDGGTSGTLGAGNVINNATLAFNRSDSVVFGGAISGSGGLAQTGTGTLILTAANNYAGGTTIASGSTLQIGNGGTTGTLGTGAVTNDGVLAVNFASTSTIIDIADPISGAGSLNIISGGVFLSGTNTYSGPTTIAAGAGLQIGNGGTTGTLGTGAVTNNGVLQVNRSGTSVLSSAISGSGIFRQLGTGTTILTGANTYSGGTTISAGTLQIGNGGTSGSISGNIVNNAALAFNRSDDLTHAGTISGSGSLTKAGAGTLTLTGANTHAGGTTISAGTLQIGNGGTSGSISGNIVNNAALAFSRSDNLTYTGNISGTGALTKAGAGTLTLTGANTHAGGTTISAGTLQIGNGGTSGSISGNIVNNAALAFSRSDILTYTGTISGTGSLTKAGAGTLTLTGANTHAGGTTISAGTLQIGNGGTSGSVSGNIVNNAALAFNRSDDLTYAGNISGSGSLTKAGAGTLTLTGSNTYTGGTAVNGGTLAIGAPDALASGPVTFSGGTLQFTYSGTLDRSIAVDAGGFTVDTNGNAQTMSAPLTGSGAFTKIGSNSLNLTGNSTFGGATFVQEGRLAVNGSLENSHVTVQSGGTLGGNGTVGGIVTQSGGIVAPGNSIGTLNVAGNVTFGPGSLYQVEVNAAGQSDRIAATGTATLNGGTVQVLAETSSYKPSTTYTILTAAGGRTGTFGGVTSDLAFLTPTLGYDVNAVTLTLVRKTDPEPPTPEPPTPEPPAPLAFHTVAVSGNQYRTADAVEALGEGNVLFDTVVGTSANGARQAFDALSAEAHASAVTSAYADMQRVQGAILSRLRNGALAQAGDGVPPTFDLWSTGFGSSGKVSGDGNAASMDTSTGGFLIGAEAKVSETYRIGLTGGFMSTSFDIDERLSSGTDETVFGSIYGDVKWDAINVRLGALYAHHDVDVNRTVAFPGFGDRVGSSYDGSTLMAFGEVGYAFDLGRMKLEPFLGASAMRLDMDGFREEGGPAALVGYARTYELGTTMLGLRAESKLGLDLPLTMHGTVGWRHAIGDVDPSALLAFSGGASAFTVEGIPIDRDALVAEAGLDWQIGEDMTLGVSYGGQVGERAQEHAVKGNFSWRF